MSGQSQPVPVPLVARDALQASTTHALPRSQPHAPAVTPSVARIADYRLAPTVKPDLVRPVLSAREIEVLLTWLPVESKEQAAEKLFISVSTVSTHLARIRAKYVAVGRPAPTKTHLLARALQDGYTSLDEW